MNIIQALRGFDSTRTDLEELVALHSLGAIVHAGYVDLGIEEPDWLTLRIKELRREIKARLADQTEKRIKETRARIDALKTPSERRKELQAELDKLESSLQ